MTTIRIALVSFLVLSMHLFGTLRMSVLRRDNIKNLVLIRSKPNA